MEVLYIIPADNRDLNYAKYFPYGKKSFLLIENRNSFNTEHCAVNFMIKLLLKSDFIQDELNSVTTN
jgi:UDP-N-acetylglucosamine 4,6-dehydratase